MADPTVVRHADRVLSIAHGVTSDVATTLSEPIGDSWKRCVRDYSLDPVRVYSPAVISNGDLRGRQVQHEQLIQIASAEMDSLYDQIRGSGYALLLTDASGVILCEKFDANLKTLFRAAGLIIGADWSELHEGTNGIGTCISVDRPVTVHRTEHFRASHIGLSCSGAPIHDPTGSLLAVLDASTVDARGTRSSQAHTMALVNMSAQLIEKCVFLQHHHNTYIVRFHARPEFVNLLHDGSLALTEDGIIVAADNMAVRLLGAQRRQDLIGRSLEEIFDTRMEELLAPQRTSRQAIWPLRDTNQGRRFFASLHNQSIQPSSPAKPGRPAKLPPWSLPSSPRSSAKPSAPKLSTPNLSTFSPSPPNRSSPRSPSANLSPTKPTSPQRSDKTVPQVTAEALTLIALAGTDPYMQGLIRKATRIADSTLPVLIQGPTGSGKECLARALHAASQRSTQQFVAVNCAALPETLIESELFGYGPGAFTGARKEGRKGKIVQASGGTLFLDEIGDMPLTLQTRLLRVLEEQEVVPLGAEITLPVDCRVICASNQNLRGLIAKGLFRDDLYYRLNGIKLELPALAQRADKQALIQHLLDEHAGRITEQALKCLTQHDWPGNIRELRNVIRSAMAICDNGVISLRDLPSDLPDVQSDLPSNPPSDLPSDFPSNLTSNSPSNLHPKLTPTPPTPPPGKTRNPLANAEREALLKVINNNHGNLCRTASQLGISRNALYRRLRRHDITVTRSSGFSATASSPQT